MFNENYHQEYERAILEAKDLTKHLHEMIEHMEKPEEGFKYFRQDHEFRVFEKHHEALERLRHASKDYFGEH